MKAIHLGRHLIAVAILAWPMTELAQAQRGERGGDRGGARSGDGERSGDGRKFSGRQGGGRDSSRGPSRSEFGRSQQRGGNQGTRQRSYYRGPESERFERDGQPTRRDWDDRARQADRRDVDRVRRDGRWDVDRDWRDRDDWRRSADGVRRDWRGWDRNDLPFRWGWWDGHRVGWPVYSPWRYSYWRDRPYYWWGWTPANRLTSWLAFELGAPVYWDYGPGRNIYYRDNYVYHDERQLMPADDYYQEIYDLAHSVPQISEEEARTMEWSPLGVFAIMRSNEPDSERTLQLAINRDGVLTGTYLNQGTGRVHPIAGRVDERTQRAAWAFTDGEHPNVVFEASLFNLTRPESSMMVHFGPRPEDAQVWHLVRLEAPEQTEATMPTQPLPRMLP